MDAVFFVLSKYYKKHPVNLFLLGLYTLCMSVAVGFACVFAKGMISFRFLILIISKKKNALVFYL